MGDTSIFALADIADFGGRKFGAVGSPAGKSLSSRAAFSRVSLERLNELLVGRRSGFSATNVRTSTSSSSAASSSSSKGLAEAVESLATGEGVRLFVLVAVVGTARERSIALGGTTVENNGGLKARLTKHKVHLQPTGQSALSDGKR